MLKLRLFSQPVHLRCPAAMGLALASGLVMGFAPAPLNWWGLAWIALVPLWVFSFEPDVYLRHRWFRRAAHYLLPCAWGVGYHGLALSWITGLHPLTWMGVPWLASVAITLFCWGFITLWGAGMVVLWVWLVRQSDRLVVRCQPGSPIVRSPISRLWRVVLATAIWCGLESLLSLTPLYWTSLSYTQSPSNLAILHLGQLSGPMLVTAVIVAVNGLLAEAWLNTRQRGSRGEPTIAIHNSEPGTVLPTSLPRAAGKQAAVTCLAIALGLVISSHAIGYGLYRLPLVQLPETVLTVGIIQGNVPTRIKLTGAGVQRALQHYVEGYKALANRGVQAVLTPEGALPILWTEANKRANPFYQAVRDRGVVAWLGTFVETGDRITQSLLTLNQTGETVGRYNKIKLVPLGEYIPFQETLGQLIGRLSPIEANMLPGRTDQRLETPFGRAIVSICYESPFAALFRSQAAAGGEFILTASNLDPYSEVLMAQHEAQDVMRAIETDRWAVRATNTGYSGVINPHGQIIWRSIPHTYAVHAESIDRRQTQTLYVRWGDWVTPGLLAFSAIAGLLLRVKPLYIR